MGDRILLVLHHVASITWSLSNYGYSVGTDAAGPVEGSSNIEGDFSPSHLRQTILRLLNAAYERLLSGRQIFRQIVQDQCTVGRGDSQSVARHLVDSPVPVLFTAPIDFDHFEVVTASACPLDEVTVRPLWQCAL